MLIKVYLFALVLGAILLGVSFLLGGGDGDVDGDIDADFDGDVDVDADAGFEADGNIHGSDHGTHGDIGGLFGVLGSTRFWTFFAAFFGLTGLVLDGFDLANPPVVALVLAIAVGSLCGWTAVTLLRRLSAHDTGVAASASDYIGKSGEMLLGAKPGRLGKIRIELKGTTVDVLALCEDGELSRGEQGLIVEMRDHQALVVKYETGARLAPRA